MADAMSVDASASWMVRRTLRMRCRYEYHNNPFFMGGANRLARFVIGTGPRLHMGTDDKGLNEEIETSFNLWTKKIRLAEKMRTGRAARFYNGEGFNLMRNNPGIPHPVQLDVFEIECDQVASPLFGMYPSQFPDQYFDGIVLDKWGNPQIYHILKQHPGAFGAFVLMGYQFDPWEARYVLHDFRRIRPGQHRGIPDAVPALDLFAELRRYRKAVLAAAETAADHAGFIKTQGPADADTATKGNTGFGTDTDYIEIKRRMMGVLPDGYDAFQMKPEQPTTTYDMYTMALLMEISQTLDMPLFIFTGDARLANMSSAYVASQSFIKSVNVDRSEYEFLLDRIFAEWILEAQRVDGMLRSMGLAGLFSKPMPQPIPGVLIETPHGWRWDRITAHADPAKMATAAETRLESGVSSIPIECSLEGYDWEEVEESAAKSYGMSVDELRAARREKVFATRGTPTPASIAPEPNPEESDNDGDDETPTSDD